MSDVIVLEFPEGTADQYAAVNKVLGVDPETGMGDWPEPLRSHTAAHGDAGLVVVEVWDSKQDQEKFMERLMPAFQATGMPQPARVQWFSLLGHHAG